ncbi:hypothetical protein FBR02_14410 [Anaerolineae bacterium CFX9]|nr:hypothetical protein [Anaerolineae bacterium CFX9]
MAWRLHLSDRPIRRMDILTGKPNLLAAWTAADRVSFMDLQYGTKIDDRVIELPNIDDRQSDQWKGFVETLTAPNKACLPCVRTPVGMLLSAPDASLRLVHEGKAEVYLIAAGRESKLEFGRGVSLIRLEFEPTNGTIAALDTKAQLHLFQRQVKIGAFETGLTYEDELTPTLAIPDGGHVIYLSDGRRLVAIENTGTIRRSLDLHYTLGALCCSPDGKLVATSDLDANVLRIYRGDDLTATHQRFAVDLLADAKRTQLMAGAISGTAAAGPLALNNKGAFIFAMGGVICATNIAKMRSVPAASVRSPKT